MSDKHITATEIQERQSDWNRRLDDYTTRIFLGPLIERLGKIIAKVKP